MVNNAIETAVKNAKQAILQEVILAVQETIDNYLLDLQGHIGIDAGASGFSDTEVSWAPLDLESAQDTRFWYETGSVAKHIISAVEVIGNKVHAMAGLPSSAEGYQEALWNEFGWTPSGTSKIVRRALFTPLSEHHLRELNTLLEQRVGSIKIKIRVKL